MTEQQIKDRLAELYAKQEAATGWGAAVGARNEEIKSLEGQLAALRRPFTGTEALRQIADLSPRHNKYTGSLRCQQCGHRWEIDEAEHHGPHCAYVIARDALAPQFADVAQAAVGCGTPGCKDPHCTYGNDEPVWWRWRFLSQANGWSKWIALNNDEVEPFRELQGDGLEAGRIELEALYAAPRPAQGGDKGDAVAWWSGLQRYDMHFSGRGPYKSSNGHWVSWSDLEAAAPQAAKDALAELSRGDNLAYTLPKHFADAYTAARKMVPARLADEIVSRNSSEGDGSKMDRIDTETDAEFVRRIVATYLAVSSTDRCICHPLIVGRYGHNKSCPLSSTDLGSGK